MDAIQSIETVRISDRLYVEKLIVGRLMEAKYFLEKLKTSDMWAHISKQEYESAIAGEQVAIEYLEGILTRFRLGDI